jgi:hypothetical protein
MKLSQMSDKKHKRNFMYAQYTVVQACINPLRLCGLLMAICLSSNAHATIEYAFQAGSSLYKVDNPYLFGAQNPALFNKSYSGYSTDVGAAFFIPFPTDRSYLLLSGASSKIRYNDLAKLDHTKQQWDGLYQWQFSTFLRGKLSHRDDKRLFGYYDAMTDGRWALDGNGDPIINSTPSTDLELPHIKESQMEIALRVTPRVDIPVTFTRQTLRFIHPYNITPYSLNGRSTQVALRYESGRKSTFSAGVKNSTIDFPLRTSDEQSRYDTGYRDKEIFMDTAWRYTEHTIFRIRLGSVKRHFDTRHQDTLRAIDLAMDWHVRDKTWLVFGMADRPGSIDNSGDKLYLQNRNVSARMLWEATPKINLLLSTSLEQESFQQSDK